MDEPFQFSMRRMFVAVTTFCLAAFMLAFASRAGPFSTVGLALFTIAGATLGAGIGSMFRRAVIGIILGILVGFDAWYLWRAVL